MRSKYSWISLLLFILGLGVNADNPDAGSTFTGQSTTIAQGLTTIFSTNIESIVLTIPRTSLYPYTTVFTGADGKLTTSTGSSEIVATSSSTAKGEIGSSLQSVATTTDLGITWSGRGTGTGSSGPVLSTETSTITKSICSNIKLASCMTTFITTEVVTLTTSVGTSTSLSQTTHCPKINVANGDGCYTSTISVLVTFTSLVPVQTTTSTAISTQVVTAISSDTSSSTFEAQSTTSLTDLFSSTSSTWSDSTTTTSSVDTQTSSTSFGTNSTTSLSVSPLSTFSTWSNTTSPTTISTSSDTKTSSFERSSSITTFLTSTSPSGITSSSPPETSSTNSVYSIQPTSTSKCMDYVIKTLPTDGLKMSFSDGMSITLGTEIYALPTGQVTYAVMIDKDVSATGIMTSPPISTQAKVSNLKAMKERRGIFFGF